METIPVVASVDDLDEAVEYATAHPHARWYVARRARALGDPERIPSEWGGLVAAFGGNWSTSDRETASNKGEALPDGSYPIRDTGDLRRAIQAYGRAKNKARAKRHIIKRAKALNATGMLPSGWGAVTAAAEDDASFEPVEETVTAAAMTKEMEAEYQKLSKMESRSPAQEKRLKYLKSCMSKSTDHEGSSYGVTADGSDEDREAIIKAAYEAITAGDLGKDEEPVPEPEQTLVVDDLAWAAIDSVLAYVQAANPEIADQPVEALRAAAMKHFFQETDEVKEDTDSSDEPGE